MPQSCVNVLLLFFFSFPLSTFLFSFLSFFPISLTRDRERVDRVKRMFAVLFFHGLMLIDSDESLNSLNGEDSSNDETTSDGEMR